MAIYNPYKKTSSSINFYSGLRSEIDLRQELINMFDGKNPEIPKAQLALFRRMRRDSNEQLISCPCVDSLTKEPDKDRFCPVCHGEGFLWDEEVIQIYRTYEPLSSNPDKLFKMGLINQESVVFFTRYDSNIKRQDKILLVQLDVEGNIISPYKRTMLFSIDFPWDYRSDNGRIEYWKLFTSFKDVKYLNTPTYSEI